MPTVALVGTLDTKGREYGFVRDRLRELDTDVLVIDTGVLDRPLIEADITREQVAQAAGTELAALVQQHDRDAAVATMQQGATTIVQQLLAEKRIHGILALGGSSGSTLASAVMRSLPVGFPKLLISTIASGDTRPYVGTSDIAMMSSIVDISGLNRLSEPILANAAGAIAGMSKVYETFTPSAESRPLIGATMFGVTTPGVTVARERLEALGYEVLVFHATGIGGDTMESLVQSGLITGVLDMTTTEFADAHVGATLPAGPDRLLSAGRAGYPMVVSLGALDMANFGTMESVPAQFRDRKLFRHNASITLMRTTPEENAAIGKEIAERLNQATGPVTVFIPRGGLSMIDIPGQDFHDPAADEALFTALREHLDPGIKVIESGADINDPALATAMADELHLLYQHW
ncbi:MAG TPA: Tm-1-like ATP-binding domain-containing protein [Thermomicrobiales bacterium]|nr:Tm-1-like ATP-binding domain-containing protein [Thermomicrobiales bacterium]